MCADAQQPTPSAAEHQDHLAAILALIASQIETALHDTDAPVATLVETAHCLGAATQTLSRCLSDFSGSPAEVFQDLMVLHDDLHMRAGKSATAVQFHDRLVQRLTRVCSNLSNLADFIASANGSNSSLQWNELRQRMTKQRSVRAARPEWNCSKGDTLAAQDYRGSAT